MWDIPASPGLAPCRLYCINREGMKCVPVPALAEHSVQRHSITGLREMATAEWIRSGAHQPRTMQHRRDFQTSSPPLGWGDSWCPSPEKPGRTRLWVLQRDGKTPLKTGRLSGHCGCLGLGAAGNKSELGYYSGCLLLERIFCRCPMGRAGLSGAAQPKGRDVPESCFWRDRLSGARDPTVCGLSKEHCSRGQALGTRPGGFPHS